MTNRNTLSVRLENVKLVIKNVAKVTLKIFYQM